MDDLATRITAAVGGKVLLEVRSHEGHLEFVFADGSALKLHDNGRKTVTQETELCPACSLTPDSSSAYVDKAEVLATLAEKVDGHVAPPAPPPALKPPPIKLGVQGVASGLAFGSSDSGATSKYDWGKLVNHPPFQMYVNAMQGVVPGDQVQIARDFVLRQGKDLTEEQAFVDYAHWFGDQGRWPHEDALGNPLEA